MSMSERTRAPSPQALAETFYGDSFDVRTEQERDSAAGEWHLASAGDQRFVIAHLLHLGIQTLEGCRRLLIEIRDALDVEGTKSEPDDAAVETSPAVPKPPAQPTIDVDLRLDTDEELDQALDAESLDDLLLIEEDLELEADADETSKVSA